MRLSVELQLAVTDGSLLPNGTHFDHWFKSTLKCIGKPAVGVTIRIVEQAEMTELNARFRHKEGPTNVLSFPFAQIAGIEEDYLGDVVVCAAVVREEARVQGKTPEAHWAHLVIHGILHLCGYDHEAEHSALTMEWYEKKIMERLGFPDPYTEIVTVE